MVVLVCISNESLSRISSNWLLRFGGVFPVVAWFDQTIIGDNDGGDFGRIGSVSD